MSQEEEENSFGEQCSADDDRSANASQYGGSTTSAEDCADQDPCSGSDCEQSIEQNYDFQRDMENMDIDEPVQLVTIEKDIKNEEQGEIRTNKLRTTSPYMSKYEKAKVLGIRAAQISHNSPLYIESEVALEVRSAPNWALMIAEMELAQRKIPLIVRRQLPNGYFQDWLVNELKLFK